MRTARIPLACLLAASLVLCTAQAQAGSAKAGLAKAQKLYRQKKFPAAMLELKQALLQNPQSAQAHWDMARTLASLRQAGQACEHGATRSVILRHLFKACRLNPRYKRRLKKERVFRPIQDAFAWQGLVGLRVGQTAQTARVLQAVTWYGPPGPDRVPASGIDFRAKGQLVVWVRDEGSELGRKDVLGRYQVRRQRVMVSLNRALGETKEAQGELKLTGVLWLPGLPGPFSDDPGECSQ